MIISRLSAYLQQHRRASLHDMAHGLDTDAEALRHMLGVLERKGRVSRLPTGRLSSPTRSPSARRICPSMS